VQDGLRLTFADGSLVQADIVIGADGVRSQVRACLLGPEEPSYSGQAAFRAIIPTDRLDTSRLDDCVKWWGDDRIFLTYYIEPTKKDLFLVTASPQAEWPHETSSVPGSVAELRAAFAGFEPLVQDIIDVCPEPTKWAMYDHQPLPLWSRGRIVLLGDACHPMLPFMGQGAAMAIEDAAMLARCLDLTPEDPTLAFSRYELNRQDRTNSIQDESRRNVWLKDTRDADWVFGYDVIHSALLRETTSKS
jgi:6-hydroxynicotinate 3-monooxygenase